MSGSNEAGATDCLAYFRSHLSSWDLAFEVVRFTLLAPTAPDVTLETYLKKEGYSPAFFEEYLLVSFVDRSAADSSPASRRSGWCPMT